MPRTYPATVRRQIVQRLRSGETVAAIAAETGIAQATLFRWKRQAFIDAGLIEGTPSVEADELAAAHKRIAQLEAELALTRDACDLFNEQAVVPPKHRRAITEGLIARGHSARSACRITGLARSLLQYYRRRPVPDREIRRLIVADTVFEAGRWRAIGATWAMLGLDPDNHALRITGRAAVAAIDEATVYWLNNEQQFSVETMVEYMVELLAAGLRSAATLDPTLDVAVAIETLLDNQ
jgi:transposase-like protein